MQSLWLAQEARLVKSVFNSSQLPPPDQPEIAFAGRSNVGKSSLINRLLNRKNLVKVSATPGKTRSLNFFEAGTGLYLVDLPGYGFARVSRKTRNDWQGLVTSYIRNRESLLCVVVIVDLRHEAKAQDLELLTWLKNEKKPLLVVYTKQDKLSVNKRLHQAAILDAGLGITSEERVLFSAKTGEGRDDLITRLEDFVKKMRDK